MFKRKIVIIFILLSISFCLSGQNNVKYVIQGSADEKVYEGTYIYLMKTELYGGIHLKLDSAKIKNGKFKFRGEVNELPHLYQLIIFGRSKFKSRFVFVILEKGKIKIQIEKDRERVSGTPMNDMLNNKIIQPFNEWTSALEIYNLKKDSINTKGGTDRKKMKTICPFPHEELNKYKADRRNFVKTYAEYPVVDAFLFEMIMESSQDPELPAIKERLCAESKERLDKRLEIYTRIYEKRRKETEARSKIEDEKNTPETVKIGKKYTDFKGITLEGDTIKLSDIIIGKKLVLLDFWASWCGPCMNMLPFIDTLYQKYHPQGLEIVGASWDDHLVSWKKTVNARNMYWPQIFMLTNYEENGASIYGVRSIPYTVLIDINGKIIARKLRGKELELTIEKWLKEHK